MEWTGWAAIAAVLTSLAGPLINHGVMRQQLKDLKENQARQDAQIQKLTDVYESMHTLDTKLALLSMESAGANKLIMQSQTSADKLFAERFEGMRGEVRAFMQGLASAGRRAPRQPVNGRGT